MDRYLNEVMGFSADEVPALRRSYYENYGTTLQGLQINYQVDPEHYLAYVHDLPLHKYIKPSPELRDMLRSMPQARWIFTNADADHAGRVLSTMELTGCFNGIIDVRAIDFACKPHLAAYRRALTLAGNPLPENCVFLDDSPNNLAPARRLGFTTILVGSAGEAHTAATYSIPDLRALPQTMPVLWDGHSNAADWRRSDD